MYVCMFSITLEKKRVSSQFVIFVKDPAAVASDSDNKWTAHSVHSDIGDSLTLSTLTQHSALTEKCCFLFQTCPLLQEAPCQKSPSIDHQEGEVGGIPSASRLGCWPTSRWACWQLLLCRQAMGWAASTPQNSEEPHIHYSGHLSSSLQLPTSNVKTNTPPNITRKQVLDFVYEYDFI